MKSYRKRLITVLILILILSFIAFLCDGLALGISESEVEVKEQVFHTSLNLFAETPIDWGEIGKQGVGILVLIAVMFWVVSPLIKQMLESNSKLSEALLSLSTAISESNTNIIKTIKDDISDMKEDLIDEIRKKT